MTPTSTSKSSTMRLPWQAVVLVFSGAILYSSKAIFIKLAFRYGADSVSLVALRMLFSLPFFALAAWWSNKKQPLQDTSWLRRQWPFIVLLGLSGYYIASLLDFWSLEYLPAGLARLVLFVYPTLVLLLSALFLKRRINFSQALAVFITYSGIALAFSTAIDLPSKDVLLKGLLLSLGSALTYAIYLVGSGEYIPRLGSMRYTSLTMTIAAVAILVHHAIQHRLALWHFPAPVYALCLGMSVVATVVPAFMLAEGIRRIGASSASIITCIGPISTISMASLILGEPFGLWQWLGTLLVVGGVLVISLKK